jgi:ATP-dependent Lon protease
MEIVQLDGCTVQEKLAIAREHLAARQIARNGLDPAEVQVTDDAFLAIIEGYTREAGVRGLERQIGKLTTRPPLRISISMCTYWWARCRRTARWRVSPW